MGPTEMITPEEKRYMKKIGNAYLKVIKAMGIFLIAGLILTSIAVATSNPSQATVTLDAGQTTYFTQFYGEAGDNIQFAFGITKENGQEYSYPEMEGPFEFSEFLNTMEWKVNVILQYSGSVSFDSVESIKDVSGELNVVAMELYKDGFYRFQITNLDTETLTISIGKVEANIAVVIGALVSWVMLGLAAGLFGIMVHFGVWLAVIYIVIKAIKIIDEDNKQRSHPNIVGPDTKTQYPQ